MKYPGDGGGGQSQEMGNRTKNTESHLCRKEEFGSVEVGWELRECHGLCFSGEHGVKREGVGWRQWHGGMVSDWDRITRKPVMKTKLREGY